MQNSQPSERSERKAGLRKNPAIGSGAVPISVTPAICGRAFLAAETIHEGIVGAIASLDRGKRHPAPTGQRMGCIVETRKERSNPKVA